jgi:hypothetical protein
MIEGKLKSAAWLVTELEVVIDLDVNGIRQTPNYSQLP